MLTELVNFVLVDERFATAGLPTDAALLELRDTGYQVVVNLCGLDPKFNLPDEESKVRALGLRYERIPVSFEAPTHEDFVRFAAAMNDTRQNKVFVHCMMNYRVSCFTALYGEAHLGWTREEADAHVARVWTPDAVWTAFLASERLILATADSS